MKRWAVGHYSKHTNELSIEIVEAYSWQEAVRKHTKFQDYWILFTEHDDDYDQDSLEDAKQFAFDMDEGLDVVEIPA